MDIAKIQPATKAQREAWVAGARSDAGLPYDGAAQVILAYEAALQHTERELCNQREFAKAEFTLRERAEADAAAIRDSVGVLLAENGCECECGHHPDDHNEQWERCFPCRVQAVLRRHRDTGRAILDELARLRKGLTAINEIRNSIVGLQSINWSAHIYPLVSHLNDAGYKGMDFAEARSKFGTMLERIAEAEHETKRLRADVAAKDAEIGRMAASFNAQALAALQGKRDALQSQLDAAKAEIERLCDVDAAKDADIAQLCEAKDTAVNARMTSRIALGRVHAALQQIQHLTDGETGIGWAGLNELRVLLVEALKDPTGHAAAEEWRVFADVKAERARQDAQWGGPSHDDTHTSVDWLIYIDRQSGGALTSMPGPHYRSHMIKIAALAIAAVESHDRKVTARRGGGA